jgi:hypothetical protein
MDAQGITWKITFLYRTISSAAFVCDGKEESIENRVNKGSAES